MVFSQTSLNTHSHLKVVELNRLKPEKVNGTTGVITGGNTQPAEPQPAPTTSFSEVFLKPEPQFESTMFNETDCEFFQDLVKWCSDPAKEELVETDSLKQREESSHNTDTLHTTFSPQGWDVLDVNSPVQAGYYNTTPNDPLSPTMSGLPTFDSKFSFKTDEEDTKNLQYKEQMWDIPNLPVVLGDLASEEMADFNPNPITGEVGFYNHTFELHDTEYTPAMNTQKMLLMDEEDSVDLKLNAVIPSEVENNNIVVTECIIGDKGVLERRRPDRRGAGLTLEVPPAAPWAAGTISTPEVLSYVEQLEKEKGPIPIARPTQPWPLQDMGYVSTVTSSEITSIPPSDYEPNTPKSESHLESDVEDAKSCSSSRKRRNSEDSDETYTPYTEYTPRKYKRRKPSIPIKDMILALEESQQLRKAKRGRPPKRRESTVSSVCSMDDNTSTASTHELVYRRQRDKNNEASKRSRMNRKLKELQTEQLAIELEERNKKLKVKADILEDMTKRLKDALMTAILQK
ncbi:uncharacterized protein LOC126370067 [Pectinophora gossypiella]|uniref:uncharacterized protein LOC126370067 n=1 Tax=Pectinophora gossypiella TaxID=13191 RepID=UPI00214F35D2|nr:uncharacterized protein LOC126370067 [Pectinophora gossypiella]XP_049870673.1 uncharacterized protein LOC126370067 [Pectinophora gossypiella]XP_049870674.1 uncharacterized protein LOC126370067 [Pectinophora gossypiella]